MPRLSEQGRELLNLIFCPLFTTHLEGVNQHSCHQPQSRTLFWSQSGHRSYTERPEVARNFAFSVGRYEIKPFSVWQSADADPIMASGSPFVVSAKSRPAQPPRGSPILCG